MLKAIALRHVAFEDLGVLEPILVRFGYDVHYMDVGSSRINEQVAVNADLLVVLGGPISAYDSAKYPFLDKELAAIAARTKKGLPTLGVCLGAQLIASALGASVRPTGRKEIGFSPIFLTPAGERSVLAPLSQVHVLHWHGDEFSVPSGSASLASTPGFPNQAFAVGRHVLGLQFHLEADHAKVESWLIGHAAELNQAGVDPTTLRRDAVIHGPALINAATVVFSNWIRCL